MSEKVMFVRHGEGRPRNLEDKDRRPMPSFDTPEGFRVYISDDLNAVGALCTVNADKYRLFRSKSFKVREINPNGSSKLVDLESWDYRTETFDTRTVDERDQKIYGKRMVWFKHGPEGVVEPTEQSITGKKPADIPEVYGLLALGRAKVAELEKANAELVKANIALVEKIEGLQGRLEVSELIPGHVPVVSVTLDPADVPTPQVPAPVPAPQTPAPIPAKKKAPGRPKFEALGSV
jgi:hypothetical protein